MMETALYLSTRRHLRILKSGHYFPVHTAPGHHQARLQAEEYRQHLQRGGIHLQRQDLRAPEPGQRRRRPAGPYFTSFACHSDERRQLPREGQKKGWDYSVNCQWAN